MKLEEENITSVMTEPQPISTNNYIRTNMAWENCLYKTMMGPYNFKKKKVLFLFKTISS